MVTGVGNVGRSITVLSQPINGVKSLVIIVPFDIQFAAITL